jgi:hypothetical protein
VPPEFLKDFDSVSLRSLCFLRNSLRYLCVLGVSAVEKCAPDLYRRDAENAEAAQRMSFKSYLSASIREAGQLCVENRAS